MLLFADDGVPGFRTADWPWWAIAVFLLIDKLYPWVKGWWADAPARAKASVEVDLERVHVDDAKAAGELSRQGQIIKQWERLTARLTDEFAKKEEKWERKIAELETANRSLVEKSSSQAERIINLTEKVHTLTLREATQAEEISRLRNAIWRMKDEGAEVDSDLFDTPHPDEGPTP